MTKIICITWATSWIGYACAQRFSQAGNDLILVARNEKKLQEMKNQLGWNIVTIAADVGKREMLHATLAPVKDMPVDILVNCAGVSRNMDLLRKANLDDRDEMIDTNIKWTLYMTRFFLPQMIERKAGHIVNISSISAEHAYLGWNVYCMTKAAINMLAKCLRDELKDTWVKLTNIMPGLVDTHFQLYRFDEDQIKADAKVGWRPQLSPDEVAEAIFSACEKWLSFSNIEMVKW